VTPPPQPSAVATIAANPTVIATITPNPTAAQLTPTGTVTLPPTTTLTPTPIPSPTLTPIITIETMDEGTGSGTQITSTTPTVASGNNSNLVQTGLPLFILGILGGVNLFMLKFTGSDRSDYQARRRKIKRYTIR
ncbi:hypothetical protein KBD45_05105, partial [Candidatus Dojkabacteria bacterium]|nr:hypothetical protein [Candidatus Dojkabacteria bacterium]